MSIMGISEMMDRSMLIFKKRFGQFTLFSLLYGIIIFILNNFLSVPLFFTMALVPAEYAVFLALLITFILLVILCFSFSIGIINITMQDINSTKVSLGNIIGNSIKDTPKAVAVIIINFLIFLPITAVYAFLLYAFYNFTNTLFFVSLESRLSEIIFIVILVALIILADIIIVAYLGFTFFCVFLIVEEKSGIIASIKKSFWLIKNDIRRVFWSLFVFQITVLSLYASLMSFLISATFIIMIIFVKLLETEYILLGMLVIPIYFLITIVSTVIMFISFELANIMSSLLCYNQKFRKEGYDIILRLMEIEKRKRGINQ